MDYVEDVQIQLPQAQWDYRLDLWLKFSPISSMEVSRSLIQGDGDKYKLWYHS